MADTILDVQAYDFLIQPIRHEDQSVGNEFVKRLLMGRQAIWEATQQRIFDLKKLNSITECPDDLLIYLKHLLGWTDEPIVDRVTRGLDVTTLRRLLNASIPLWQGRGTETTLADVLLLLVGGRVRIWNWFDFRWVVDETGLAEIHEGRDPWIVDLPGAPNYDERRFNVRIVDDGTIDRDLVEAIAQLMRPCGERIEVSYLRFLDLFEQDTDTGQWAALVGVLPTVSSGSMHMLDETGAEFVAVDVSGSLTWSSYGAYARVKLPSDLTGSMGLAGYVQDANNYYEARLTPDTNTLALVKVIASTPTVLGSFDFTTIGQALHHGVWYGLRLQLYPDGANTRVRAWLDGDLYIDVTDNAFSQGTIGLLHSIGGELEAGEVEAIPIPMDTVTIDINPS
jgi:hypothetical protein